MPTDKDDFLDFPLFELGVEIGIGEAALAPVFMHDDVAVAWSEFRMELSAPRFQRRNPGSGSRQFGMGSYASTL